jgi:ribosomal-protein-alanine N-acetyltransferase
MTGARSVEIGPADVTTAGTLAKLHARASTEPWTAADMARWLAMPAVTALLALGRGVPLGFILAQRVADQAEILTLAVDPVARRQGVGGALLDRLQIALEADGVASLYLEVATDNVAACALYKGRGFLETALRRGYYCRSNSPPVDAMLMIKAMGS